MFVSVPSDHDLMSTMMTRITQLEAKVAYQAKEMTEKVSFILTFRQITLRNSKQFTMKKNAKLVMNAFQ